MRRSLRDSFSNGNAVCLVKSALHGMSLQPLRRRWIFRRPLGKLNLPNMKSLKHLRFFLYEMR